MLIFIISTLMSNSQELDFLKRRADANPTSLKNHFELAKAYFNHNDHKLAMESLRNSFDLQGKDGKQDEKLKFDLYLLKIKIEHEGNYPIDTIKKTYLKILELMQTNHHNSKFNEHDIIDFVKEIKKTYFKEEIDGNNVFLKNLTYFILFF